MKLLCCKIEIVKYMYYLSSSVILTSDCRLENLVSVCAIVETFVTFLGLFLNRNVWHSRHKGRVYLTFRIRVSLAHILCILNCGLSLIDKFDTCAIFHKVDSADSTCSVHAASKNRQHADGVCGRLPTLLMRKIMPCGWRMDAEAMTILWAYSNSFHLSFIYSHQCLD